MLKVLILAYDFPPYISVGAQRPYYWYKYFREYGIEPVVVSRQWNNNFTGADQYVAEGYSDVDVIKETEFGMLLKAPYKPNAANRLYLKYGDKKFRFIRKVISGYYEIMQWYFPIGPKMGIYKTSKEYISKNKVDIIIASGDPYILFKYASKLSIKYSIPWIADYRDPWIEKPANHSLALYLKKQFDFWNERRFLKNVSFITTVSEYFEALIRTHINNKSYKVIPNGFDADSIKEAITVNQNAEFFTITYIGRIYKYYPLEYLLSILNEFVKNNSSIKMRLQFIGISGEFNLELIKQKFPETSFHINIIPPQSSIDLFSYLAASNVLLLFNMYSIIGTKIYDYIAIKRKILLCFSDDNEAKKLKENYFTSEMEGISGQNASSQLILEKDAGIIVKNKEHLLDVLNNLYKEFSETGQIACHSKDISEYSRRAQTEKLAALIHEILKTNYKFQ